MHLIVRAMTLIPENELRQPLDSILASLDGLLVTRSLAELPSAENLSRLLQVHAPQIVFVSAVDYERFCETIEAIRADCPAMQIVAIDHECLADKLLNLMTRNVHEFISAPIDEGTVLAALLRIRRQLELNPELLNGTERIYSFLPAKAGVGATTLAVNTAAAVAAFRNERVFLGDFDLNSGLMRFQLKLDSQGSILDASQMMPNVDEQQWAKLITRFKTLDVIHSGHVNPLARMEMEHLRHLISHLRRAYRVVVADLSGNMERYSIEIMSESKHIFLVTTPELPALHLAREKFLALQKLDLGNRVWVLLNRFDQRRSPLSLQEVERLVGRPVGLTFKNDYRTIHAANANGSFVEQGTDLSLSCAQLAKAIYHDSLDSGESRAAKTSFVEYFSLVPTLYRAQRR